MWIHSKRLEQVGGFILCLVHCLAHIHVGDMDRDASPRFIAEFQRCLKTCCAEMFYASARAQAGVGAAAMQKQLETASIFEALFREVPNEKDQIALIQELVSGDHQFMDAGMQERLKQYAAHKAGK